jgi:murein DD-endopeptidase MepM/ murein hydrolase activator NlpD
MELQIHPASGRGTVRTLAAGARGERVVVALAGAAALAALSLWITVPSMLRRWMRDEDAPRLSLEIEEVKLARAEVSRQAAALKARSLDRGDLLNRIAFLYDVPVAAWPRTLAPERGALTASAADVIAARLPSYLRGLDAGRELLSAREAADKDLPSRVPAILPIPDRLSEPVGFFGPRVSPWTGGAEFFTGLELAAPEGAAVLAPGAGVVLFTGSVRASAAGRLWQLGNFAVLSHGPSGITLFGHLAKIEVRRGQRVVRRQRLGLSGKSGWALAPGLHYEYWRDQGDGLRPTDPLFAVLDQRQRVGDVSLERMVATSAPGPVESVPGAR